MEVAITINKEIQDYISRVVFVVPNLSYSQKQTIERIYFYYNSKFESGEVDMDGDRKYFYNIVRNPCKVFTKAIDFDTKNIRLLTVGGSNPLKTWFMERSLKYWMRDKQFGKILNRTFKELPIFGSVVIKIVEGQPYFVDLRNFVVEQSADTIMDSNYVIEIHNMTVNEFRKTAKKMKWAEDKVKKTIEQFYKMKDTSHIRVYERYGDLMNEQGEWKYMRTFFADVQIEYLDEMNKMIKVPGIELSSEEWKSEDVENMYWEFHKDKIPGRWLGVGVVEELFEPQIKQNEIANLQGKSAYWKALMVFQTRDGAINRNLATGVQNGEILNVESEITQIDMSDRNLAFFNEETRKWMNNRDELVFSYDAVQGERSPAGTPLGSTQISISQTLSYFEGIQEDVAMVFKEMIYDIIIPQFEKEMSKEHIIRLIGEDLNTYSEMVKNELVLQEVIRQVSMGNDLPTEDEKAVIEVAILEAIKQKKEHLLTIPKGYFEDVKYDVDIDITGESVDTRVRYATRFALLQAITADPSMTTDPVKRKILFGMAEDGGINPNELFSAETKSPEEIIPGRAGGGVSTPALGTAIPGMQTATV